MRHSVVLAALGALVAIHTASAADMPLKARPVPTVAAYSWTGCYLGIEGGGSWGHSRDMNSDPTAGPLAEIGANSLGGGLVGGTVGCNYEVNSWVFGIEGDASWTDAQGSGNAIPPFLASTVANFRESSFSTVRGRIGYAFADRWLAYATGGLAVTTARLNISDSVFGINQSQSQTATGWTVGGGLEYAFYQNWSAKVEYLHADFGNIGYFDPTLALAGGAYLLLHQSVHPTDDLVRAGINYRF
jgi:outer membrane immunogenic protein